MIYISISCQKSISTLVQKSFGIYVPTKNINTVAVVKETQRTITVHKFRNFSATQILCETTFGNFSEIILENFLNFHTVRKDILLQNTSQVSAL